MTVPQTVLLSAFPLVFATYIPMCTPKVTPTVGPSNAPIAALWERPDDLAARNLYVGPWGASHAPDPKATYTFVRPKNGGINPGLVVQDPAGREWHVKQAPRAARTDRGDEGPAEVVLSRILSAIGYHQPPVYFLPAFTLRDATGTRTEPGGRFRLDVPSLKSRGDWSWQENPYVGMRPYQGLLVTLLLFNSTDLKNSNNTVYDVDRGTGTRQWYVVRDLGAALGKTGRYTPPRNNLEMFTRTGFITGVDRGFVVFDFHGFHQELIRGRITSEDVNWADAMLSRLTAPQWRDAFRAGGYAPDVAERFIAAIRARLSEGRQITADDGPA